MTWLKYAITAVLCTATICICFLGGCRNKENPTTSGTVIILNGPSSVGKSSIIKAFQAKQTTPWLGTGIDHLYIGVIPPIWLDDKPEHKAIMTIVTSHDAQGRPTVTAVFGPEGQKVIKGMHRAIAAYAHAGNNVIVDYIKYEDAWIPDLKEALRGVKVIWVGVNASLASIEQREKQRGTSPIGHAHSHYHTVHKNMSYDLILNTDQLTPEQAADEIINYMEILRKDSSQSVGSSPQQEDHSGQNDQALAAKIQEYNKREPRYPSYVDVNHHGWICLRASCDLAKDAIVATADFEKTNNAFIANHPSEEYKYVGIMDVTPDGKPIYGKIRGKYAFCNHSCNPNCIVDKNWHIVTIRPVKQDEELTTAYDAFVPNLAWQQSWSFVCQCGASCCKKIIDHYRTDIIYPTKKT